MCKRLSVGKQLGASEGMSLLEIILAVAFLSLSLVALVTMGSVVLGNAGTARDQALADQYARDGVEYLRSYRDNNGWDEFRKFGNTPAGTTMTSTSGLNTKLYTYVLGPNKEVKNPMGFQGVVGYGDETVAGTDMYIHWNDFCSGAKSYFINGFTQPGTKIGSGFYRGIAVIYPNDNTARIRVHVCYARNGAVRDSMVETTLTNWK